MRYTYLIYILLLISSCKRKEKELSKSYTRISSYLQEAKIKDPSLIYFYAGKPRLPLPNVHCFDKNGMKLSSPAQCFGIIDNYISLLNTAAVPVDTGSQSLAAFLDSIPIIDAYNKRLQIKDIGVYDYYLFVDFIVLPIPEFQETLFKARKGVKESDKKIKLLLVHALSEKNAGFFDKKDTAVSPMN